MNQALTLNEAVEHFDERFPHIDVKGSLTAMQNQHGRALTLQTCSVWLQRETRARKPNRKGDKSDSTPPAPGFCGWWKDHPHSGFADKQQPEFGSSTTPHWGILPSMAWMILRYREEWESFNQRRNQ